MVVDAAGSITTSTIDIVVVGSKVMTTNGDEVVSIAANVLDGPWLDEGEADVGGALEGAAEGSLRRVLEGKFEVVLVSSAPPPPAPPPPPPPPPPTGGTTAPPPAAGTAIGTTGSYWFPLASVMGGAVL